MTSRYSHILNFGSFVLLCTVISVVLGLSIGVTSCRKSPEGMTCLEDATCGPGFDCFNKICVPVCTEDNQCHSSQKCYRYHCVANGRVTDIKSGTYPTPPHQPRSRRKIVTPAARPRANTRYMNKAAQNPLPSPDTTAAELRALRREMEGLRSDVKKLLERQN